MTADADELRYNEFIENELFKKFYCQVFRLYVDEETEKNAQQGEFVENQIDLSNDAKRAEQIVFQSEKINNIKDRIDFINEISKLPSYQSSAYLQEVLAIGLFNVSTIAQSSKDILNISAILELLPMFHENRNIQLAMAKTLVNASFKATNTKDSLYSVDKICKIPKYYDDFEMQSLCAKAIANAATKEQSKKISFKIAEEIKAIPSYAEGNQIDNTYRLLLGELGSQKYSTDQSVEKEIEIAPYYGLNEAKKTVATFRCQGEPNKPMRFDYQIRNKLIKQITKPTTYKENRRSIGIVNSKYAVWIWEKEYVKLLREAIPQVTTNKNNLHILILSEQLYLFGQDGEEKQQLINYFTQNYIRLIDTRHQRMFWWAVGNLRNFDDPFPKLAIKKILDNETKKSLLNDVNLFYNFGSWVEYLRKALETNKENILELIRSWPDKTMNNTRTIDLSGFISKLISYLPKINNNSEDFKRLVTEDKSYDIILTRDNITYSICKVIRLVISNYNELKTTWNHFDQLVNGLSINRARQLHDVILGNVIDKYFNIFSHLDDQLIVNIINKDFQPFFASYQEREETKNQFLHKDKHFSFVEDASRLLKGKLNSPSSKYWDKKWRICFLQKLTSKYKAAEINEAGAIVDIQNKISEVINIIDQPINNNEPLNFRLELIEECLHFDIKHKTLLARVIERMPTWINEKLEKYKDVTNLTNSELTLDEDGCLFVAECCLNFKYGSLEILDDDRSKKLLNVFKYVLLNTWESFIEELTNTIKGIEKGKKKVELEGYMVKMKRTVLNMFNDVLQHFDSSTRSQDGRNLLHLIARMAEHRSDVYLLGREILVKHRERFELGAFPPYTTEKNK